MNRKMNAEKYSEMDAMLENIELPEDLDRLIEESVEKGYERMRKNRHGGRISMMKRAAVILGVVAAGGAVSFPVRAIVSSMVQDRMEQIPAESLEDLVEDINNQQAGYDSFSRSFTREEEQRFAELKMAYSQGTFPEGELRQEKSADESITDVLYFAADTSTFYFPERGLTDEELLQIVDFNARRDYGLAQEVEKMQEEAAGRVEAAGGVTEADALASGKEWALKLYGAAGDWMDTDYNLYVNDYTYDYMVYDIVFGVKRTPYYFFEIDSRDGSMVSTFAFSETEQEISTADIQGKLLSLREKAEEILSGPLEKKGAFDRVVCSYMDNGGKLEGSAVSFFFVKSDGSAFVVSMDVFEEIFTEYRPIENYEEYIKNIQEALEAARQEGSVLSGPEGEYVFVDMK